MRLRSAESQTLGARGCCHQATVACQLIVPVLCFDSVLALSISLTPLSFPVCSSYLQPHALLRNHHYKFCLSYGTVAVLYVPQLTRRTDPNELELTHTDPHGLVPLRSLLRCSSSCALSTAILLLNLLIGCLSSTLSILPLRHLYALLPFIRLGFYPPRTPFLCEHKIHVRKLFSPTPDHSRGPP